MGITMEMVVQMLVTIVVMAAVETFVGSGLIKVFINMFILYLSQLSGVIERTHKNMREVFYFCINFLVSYFCPFENSARQVSLKCQRSSDLFSFISNM